MVWKGRNLEGQKYHLEEALQCSNGRPLSRNVVRVFPHLTGSLIRVS